MNSLLKSGPSLPTIDEPKLQDTKIVATYKSAVPVMKAELCYTLDSGKWQERQWEAIEATLDKTQSRIEAGLPAGTTVWYVNLFDDRNCVVSTKHFCVK